MSSEFFGQFVEIFSWSPYSKPHPGTMQYCFMGKTFMVRLSTTKSMKSLPPEKYPLYGIPSLILTETTVLPNTYKNNNNVPVE